MWLRYNVLSLSLKIFARDVSCAWKTLSFPLSSFQFPILPLDAPGTLPPLCLFDITSSVG